MSGLDSETMSEAFWGELRYGLAVVSVLYLYRG